MLIGFSTLLAVIFLTLFFKSVKDGQYEDTYTPAVRMLFDDEPQSETNPQSQTDPQEAH